MWQTAQLITADTIRWSGSGQPFDGFIALSVVLPDGFDYPVKIGSKLTLPDVIRVRISNGVINPRAKIPFNSSYAPPGTQYTAAWYDVFGHLITTSAAFTIEANPYTISVPFAGVSGSSTWGTITTTWGGESGSWGSA